MLSIRRKYFIIALLAVILMLVLAFSALAADFEEFNKAMDEEDQAVKTPNLWLDFLKLFLVLGLIFGLAWSLIRIFGKQVNSKMQGTWLHVVDEVMLGQNRGIVLCEIGEKLYALGVSDHNISFLFEVNNAKLLEEISEGAYSMDGSTVAYQDIKKRFFQILKVKKTKAPRQKDFHFLVEEQIQRLENISHKSMEDIGAGRRKNGEDN